MRFSTYIIIVLLLGLGTQAQAGSLEDLSDLKADLAAMQEKHIPMLVFFHASYCHWCHEVEGSFLEPLSRNEEYAERTLFRRVGLDTGKMLITAEGDRLRDRDFANQYNVRFAPTLMFLGPDGEPLGRPVVGVASYDLYGGQIERALRTAEQCLADPMLEQCAR